MIKNIRTLYRYRRKMFCLISRHLTDFRARDGPVKVTEGHKCELPEIGEEAVITLDYWHR